MQPREEVSLAGAIPIRRDFYPPGQYPEACATDNLADPAINPYTLAQSFTYRRRWTGRHFSMHRDLIRCMCLDAGDELPPPGGPSWITAGQAGNPRPWLCWDNCLNVPSR